MNTYQIFDYYEKYLFKGDFEQILKIARSSKQREIESQTLRNSVSANGLPEYTTVDVSRLSNEFDPSTARCAIPMAMALLATMQFFGQLFNADKPKTLVDDMSRNLKDFFLYAFGETTHPKERDLLISVIRNGIMHSFSVRSDKVIIELDPDDTSEVYLDILGDDFIRLRVMALYNVVKKTIDKAKIESEQNKSFNDQLLHNFHAWLAFKKDRTEKDFREFKAWSSKKNRPTKEL